MDLPLKLISLRKEKGLTQIDLAEKLNVSRQAISKWEVGTTVPGTDKLKALSELYGVSVDYLLNDDMDLPPQPAGEPVQAPSVPVAKDDGKKASPHLMWVVIAALVIAIVISAVSCMTISYFKEQNNKPVPMEDMCTETGSHSDKTFSFD